MFKRNKKNLNSKNTRHLITKLNPKSPISEQYRTLRTNLQFSSVDENLKSITITSSDPAAGKSMTAANLAVVYAQQGKKTLIVDADMRKPTVHYTFRLNNLQGLSNVLIGEATIHDTVVQTDIDNLHALSSGPIPPNPSELLASNRMVKIIEEIYELYDFVIFDSPPALVVTDAKVLANITDGVILVVRSGVSRVEDSEKTIQLLNDGQSKVLGVVLNDRDKTKTNYAYYYGS